MGMRFATKLAHYGFLLSDTDPHGKQEAPAQVLTSQPHSNQSKPDYQMQ